MADTVGSLVNYILGFIVIYVAASYIFSPRRTFGNIQSRWHKPFDFQFSTMDFYTALNAAIQEKKIPDVSINKVQYSQSGILSTARNYMQIKRGNQMFLICAAPFGTGFFVSWWFGEPLNFIKDLIPRIPFLGKQMGSWFLTKTFFQMDTDTMFKESIKECVLEVIQKMTDKHGTRGLTELERQSQELSLSVRYN